MMQGVSYECKSLILAVALEANSVDVLTKAATSLSSQSLPSQIYIDVESPSILQHAANLSRTKILQIDLASSTLANVT